MVSELDLPASFSGSFCATRGEVLLVPLSPSDSSSSAVKASMVVVMFPTNMSIWVSSATPDRTYACARYSGIFSKPIVVTIIMINLAAFLRPICVFISMVLRSGILHILMMVL